MKIIRALAAVVMAALLSGALYLFFEGRLDIMPADDKKTVAAVSIQSREAERQSDHNAANGTAENIERLTDEQVLSDLSVFDDAVFVGDSLTVVLTIYSEGGGTGNADFVCASSLGYNNALWELERKGNVHPLYKGKKCTAFDGVKQSGKNKVFILLGMNDIGVYGVEGAIEGMKEFSDRMLETNPEAVLYFQGVPPMLKNKQTENLNNKKIREFNEKLSSWCGENGYEYFDIYSCVADEKGDLLKENCSDPDGMGIHPSMAACEKWIGQIQLTMYNNRMDKLEQEINTIREGINDHIFL